MPASVPTDEIYERYLKKAISEINELGDELARAGDELRVPVVGSGHPLVFIIGPCVIESQQHAVNLAVEIAAVAARVGCPVVFKASFDKANRTSIHSYRGPGLTAGKRRLLPREVQPTLLRGRVVALQAMFCEQRSDP